VGRSLYSGVLVPYATDEKVSVACDPIAVSRHPPAFTLTEPHQEFAYARPFGPFPCPLGPPDDWRRLGVSSSFAPRRYRRRTSKWE